MGLLTWLPREPDTRSWDGKMAVFAACCGVVVVKSLHQPWELLLAQLGLLVLALASRVPLAALLVRCLVVLPFTAAALPLLVTVEGTEIATLAGFAITAEGLERFLVIACHCWLCYQVLILATTVSGPYELLKGLRRWGVPRRLVDLLDLTLRYLDLLLDEARRMQRSRRLREGRRSWPGRLRTHGQMVGTLFLRTLDRAERVSLARQLRRPHRGGSDAIVGTSLSGGQRAALVGGLLATLGILLR